MERTTVLATLFSLTLFGCSVGGAPAYWTMDDEAALQPVPTLASEVRPVADPVGQPQVPAIASALVETPAPAPASEMTDEVGE